MDELSQYLHDIVRAIDKYSCLLKRGVPRIACWFGEVPGEELDSLVGLGHVFSSACVFVSGVVGCLYGFRGLPLEYLAQNHRPPRPKLFLKLRPNP